MDLVLTDEQLSDFDVEYVDEKRWGSFQQAVNSDFPDGNFSLLDIGGGNGMFADRVLSSYPKARATVLDLSPMLLGKNRPHPQKSIVQGSALELDKIQERYDVVCLNWVLHHLIADTYAGCIRNIVRTLMRARQLLTPRGRLSIYDNLYDGVIVDIAPSWLIYQLTSTKALAPIVRAGGANTAGVGVCFQSRRRWFSHFRDAGLQVEGFTPYPAFGKSLAIKTVFAAALHLKPEGPAHFWLRSLNAADRH